MGQRQEVGALGLGSEMLVEVDAKQEHEVWSAGIARLAGFEELVGLDAEVQWRLFAKEGKRRSYWAIAEALKLARSFEKLMVRLVYFFDAPFEELKVLGSIDLGRALVISTLSSALQRPFTQVVCFNTHFPGVERMPGDRVSLLQNPQGAIEGALILAKCPRPRSIGDASLDPYGL